MNPSSDSLRSFLTVLEQRWEHSTEQLQKQQELLELCIKQQSENAARLSEWATTCAILRQECRELRQENQQLKAEIRTLSRHLRTLSVISERSLRRPPTKSKPIQ